MSSLSLLMLRSMGKNLVNQNHESVIKWAEIVPPHACPKFTKSLYLRVLPGYFVSDSGFHIRSKARIENAS